MQRKYLRTKLNNYITSAIDRLERLVSEMIYYVPSGTHTHSLTLAPPSEPRPD